MISTADPEALHRADQLRRFVRGSGIAAGGIVFGGVLTLLTGVVFARWLKPEEFGTYSIAMAMIALLGGLGAAGMDTAAARFVAFYSGTGARRLVIPVIRHGVRWAMTLSVCLAAFTLWFVRSGSELPSKLGSLRPFSSYVAAAIPCVAVLLVLQHAILGLGGIKTRMLIEKVVQPLLRLVLPFVLVFLGVGRLAAAVAGVLFATVAAVVIAGIVLRTFVAEFPSGCRPTAGEVREWSDYALPFALQSLQQFVSSGLGIDILLVGALASLSASGIYAAAFRLALLLMLVRSAMDYAFGPRVSVLFGEGDLHSIDVLYKASSTIGLAFTLPFGVIFVLFSRLLMTTCFGLSYAEGSSALAWLVWGCVVDSATGCNTTLLAMVGRSWLVLANGLLGGILTVVLCLLLIPRFGISGAAFSVSAARTCVNALATIELWKLQRLQPFGRTTARIFLPVVLAVSVAIALRMHPVLPGWNSLANLAAAITAVLGAYLVALRFSGLRWPKVT